MITYKLIRSKRRTIAIEIRAGGEVIVRAPMKSSLEFIQRMVASRQDWIVKSVVRMKKLHDDTIYTLNPRSIQELKKEGAKLLPVRTEYFARLLGENYSKVRITSARKRWGSCSARGVISYSWRLMYAPPEVIDSVVLHEVVHLRHKNHSRAFWNTVYNVMPDYKIRHKWLKDHQYIISKLEDRKQD